MNDLIKVGNYSVSVIEWKNERVITTAQLAEVYETNTDNIKKNFSRNQNRFEEGKHYFLLKGEELKVFKGEVTDSPLVTPNVNQFYLWTRRGASRHCKLLGTDKAWEQFDNMEESYFEPTGNGIKLPGTYKEALQQLLITVEEKEALETTVKVKDQQISEMKPKVTYYDLVLHCKGLLSMTAISKDYGKSAQWMNEKLHGLGVQYCQGGVWFLYQKYAGHGYTHTQPYIYPDSAGIPCSRPHTYWTQSGRLFIYEQLKKNGIVPLIEKSAQLSFTEVY